ncbi:hypothetical protein FKR81_18340 [Lentzea tibetensis]|uniref:Uncharacterized protein n=1 Tax=Lentzea tibetensis TaxID=2591470 RepID=A0A563ETH6_9PSEU|nr:hypothetical protein [Lentzea tibetensis]TWP51027.1 hypothetical protein FKR81_18340 [Lentzea tibetensis]
MALAERQSEFHRSVVEVVYRTMDLLARSASPSEAYELREELRAALPWWRGLLRVHEPNGAHRCRSCRTWYGRSRPWPCPVWRDATQTLNNLNDLYGFLPNVSGGEGTVPQQHVRQERVTVQVRDQASLKD